MRQLLRDNSYFLVFFGILFFIFLWPFIFLKETLRHGDYGLQFYPWAFHYFQTLHGGHLPYWTNLVSSGFPLVAEGQIAAYYFLHGITYFLLPFQWAYTWNIPIHFLLGGVGFYLYARKAGLSREGSALAAVVFSFGSGYGGHFYTTGTLRVLTWLPWGMLAAQFLLEGARRSFFWVSALAFFISQMWTAGFPQLALYAFFYLGLLILFHGRAGLWPFSRYLSAFFLGTLIAAPQIFSSLELAAVSVREGQPLGFALWGSILPPAFLGLVFPRWGFFLKASFYIGMPAFFLACLSVASPKSKLEKIHVFLALVFYFLSLGQHNPFYVLAVKWLGVTGMRNPSKFLFFSIVSLGILAGFGLEKVLQVEKEALVRRWKKITAALCFAVFSIPLAASIFFKAFENRIALFGQRYARTYFEAKEGVAHALSYYQDQMAGYLAAVERLVRVSDFWNVYAFTAASASAFILFVYFRNRNRRFLKIALLIFTVLDLSFFGLKLSTGFVGNAEPFPGPKPAVLERLAILQSRGSVEGSAVEWAAAGHEIFEASTNMLYGIPHVGGYSPLFLKRYYELFYELGFVDGSLGRHPLDESVWTEERPLFDLAGVSALVSDKALSVPRLELREKVGDRFLYENQAALPLLHGVSSWKVIPDKNERLAYLKNRSFDPAAEAVLESPLGFSGVSSAGVPEVLEIEKFALSIRARVRSADAAVWVFRSAFYPRWKARIDGVKRPAFPVDHAFTGIETGPGEHRLEFYYDNFPDRLWQLVSLLVFFTLLWVNTVRWPKSP
jgi:hypothetical protein